MKEIMGIVVVTTIAYTIYKLFELFVRRKERMAMIEKLSGGIDPQVFSNQLNTFTWKSKSDNAWAIRIGLLLIGVGFGIAVTSFIDISLTIPNDYRYKHALDVLYPASAALFGGIGLVAAYFIEKKYDKSDK